MMLFFWLLLYGLLYIVSSQMQRAFSIRCIDTGWVMLAYLLCLLAWIYKSGRSRMIGLSAPDMGEAGAYGNLVFLATLPAYNVMTAQDWEMDVSLMLLLATAAVAEELFFRGFVFYSLLKKTSCGAWITSVAFALAHGVNYLHTGDISLTVIQILCAFTAGLHYCAVTMYYCSIMPAIAAHVLVNLTDACRIPMENLTVKYGLVLCALVHCWCGIMILKKENKKRDMK